MLCERPHDTCETTTLSSLRNLTGPNTRKYSIESRGLRRGFCTYHRQRGAAEHQAPASKGRRVAITVYRLSFWFSSYHASA